MVLRPWKGAGFGAHSYSDCLDAVVQQTLWEATLIECCTIHLFDFLLSLNLNKSPAQLLDPEPIRSPGTL